MFSGAASWCKSIAMQHLAVARCSRRLRCRRRRPASLPALLGLLLMPASGVGDPRLLALLLATIFSRSGLATRRLAMRLQRCRSLQRCLRGFDRRGRPGAKLLRSCAAATQRSLLLEEQGGR